ncbi:MAG: 5'-nucleotidase C-terminal domain-containing protein [Prevotella sp.]|nr:5'-nucleotidase C-terminal domain-containing protein [Prevotella sp.]
MKNSLYILIIIVLTLFGCVSHYQITGITRSRILIDSVFDRHPDPAAALFMEPYKHEVDSIMSPVVGRAARYMWAEKPESNLSNLLSDILVWAGTAYGETPSFAVYNMGGIRAALPAGDITYGDVLEVAPFDNKICFLSLSGNKVTELFQQIARTHGEGVSHGVRLVITPDGDLLSANLNGEEIEPDSTYRVATIDFVAQGNDNLTAFKDKTDFNAPQDTLNNVRFVIMDYFRSAAARGEDVDTQTEGRITVKSINN